MPVPSKDIEATILSIIMPVRNAEPWLHECIRSIQGQSFQNWELLAVNDFSSDASWAILESFAQEDERISVLANEGKGIIDALNTGFRNSGAPFIHRMDADDVMPPEKLWTLLELARSDRNCIATGKVHYFGAEEISAGYQRYERWLNDRCHAHDHYAWIYRECVVASANWITHRQNVNFENLCYPEDYDLLFHWYVNKTRIRCSTNVTHLWREHPHRTSKLSSHYDQKSFFQLKLNHFLQLDYDSQRPLLVFGKNLKSKIIHNILAPQRIRFHHIDMRNLMDMDNFKTPRILVAVYPNPVERARIEEYFRERELYLGMDWWWV